MAPKDEELGSLDLLICGAVLGAVDLSRGLKRKKPNGDYARAGKAAHVPAPAAKMASILDKSELTTTTTTTSAQVGDVSRSAPSTTATPPTASMKRHYGSESGAPGEKSDPMLMMAEDRDPMLTIDYTASSPPQAPAPTAQMVQPHQKHEIPPEQMNKMFMPKWRKVAKPSAQMAAMRKNLRTTGQFAQMLSGKAYVGLARDSSTTDNPLFVEDRNLTAAEAQEDDETCLEGVDFFEPQSRPNRNVLTNGAQTPAAPPTTTSTTRAEVPESVQVQSKPKLLGGQLFPQAKETEKVGSRPKALSDIRKDDAEALRSVRRDSGNVLPEDVLSLRPQSQCEHMTLEEELFGPSDDSIENEAQSTAQMTTESVALTEVFASLKQQVGSQHRALAEKLLPEEDALTEARLQYEDRINAKKPNSTKSDTPFTGDVHFKTSKTAQHQPRRKTLEEVLFPEDFETVEPQDENTTAPATEGEGSTNASSQTKPKTNFFDFPDDVRNKIYDLALVDENPIKFRTRPPYVVEPKLLRASRQIRDEALPVFYRDNAFNSRFHYDIINWLNHLSTAKLEMLQTVQLTEAVPAGYVSISLHELTERCKDGLEPDAVSVPMHVQGQKGWMTWVTRDELDQYDNVDGEHECSGPIKWKDGAKGKRKRQD